MTSATRSPLARSLPAIKTVGIIILNLGICFVQRSSCSLKPSATGSLSAHSKPKQR